MSTEDFYMIGFNVLDDIENYEESKITAEEGEAIKTVKNMLARLYTSKIMWNIRIPNKEDNSESFCDKVLRRISVYHKIGERGLKEASQPSE